MSVHIQSRVEQICAEIIQKHLGLFILALAERQVPVAEQVRRMDALVRSLMGCEVEPTLFDQGRRIPIQLDTSVTPARLRLNAELMTRLTDAEVTSSFTKPIATLLDVPTLSIGLTLQATDERQLRNLFHGAAGRMGAGVIKVTDIPAAMERNVMIFAQRLRDLVANLTSGARLKLSNPRDFINSLLGRPRWPDFEDIAQEDFIVKSRKITREAMEGAAGMPGADTILEICWESVNLSPNSFLRQTGRALRAQNLGPATSTLLEATAEVISGTRGVRQLLEIDYWPEFEEIHEAWVELCEREFDALSVYQLGAPSSPTISVLRPPRLTMSLREPEDLPWDAPLVCWSVRETNALRDLLQGFIKAYDGRGRARAGGLGFTTALSPDRYIEEPMDVEEEPSDIQMQMVGTTLESPEEYALLSERAYEACLSRMRYQLHILDADQQLRVLRMLRASYDGFFMRTRDVWSRRFQGWEQDKPHVALRRLATGVRDIFGCPILLDPFSQPNTSELQVMPTFCFVVAISPMLEQIPFYIPLSTLVMTAASGDQALRVRMVESSEDLDEPCIWCGDRELTMATLQGHPVELTLRAVEDNMLRMVAHE